MNQFNSNEKFSKIKEYNLLPFIFLFFVMLTMHSVLVIYGDDNHYTSNVLIDYDNSMKKFLSFRYYNWSSRTVVELFMALILKLNFWVWKILDVIVVCILVLSISSIFGNNNSKWINWTIVGLFLVYKFSDMSTAGWGATTLNYLWPLSFGMYSLAILTKIYRDEKVKIYEYILAFLFAIYALNVEQMCAILVVTYLCFSIIIFLKNKKNIFPMLLVILSVIELIYIMVSPGNSQRTLIEQTRYLPQFPMFSFLDKITLGICNTFYRYIFTVSLPFILLSITLMVYIWKKYEETFYRIFGGLPLVSVVIFNFFRNYFYPEFGNKINELNTIQPISMFNFYKPSTYLFLSIIIVIVIVLFVDVYLIFENNTKTLIVLGILILGFGSHIIMGFSPTVFASSTRTFLFSDFALILSELMILIKMKSEIKGKSIEFIWFLIGFFAVINYMNMIV